MSHEQTPQRNNISIAQHRKNISRLMLKPDSQHTANYSKWQREAYEKECLLSSKINMIILIHTHCIIAYITHCLPIIERQSHARMVMKNNHKHTYVGVRLQSFVRCGSQILPSQIYCQVYERAALCFSLYFHQGWNTHGKHWWLCTAKYRTKYNKIKATLRDKIIKVQDRI